MATRQQLRGDGSKEYQIITNLSRGINNSVADDVLVDNAFRDVVNFSSDQLGNIAKRDNLLNSNFKEFIRKLAYGDFTITGRPTFNLYKDDDKTYSIAEQVKLQNFYETIFTGKPYWTDTTYSTAEGVMKTNSGDYIKVNTANKNNSNVSLEGLSNVDDIVTVTDYNKEIIEHNEYRDNTAIVYYTYVFTGEKIPIKASSIPEGWNVSEDGTTISKKLFATYDSTTNLPITEDGKPTSAEDLDLILETTFGEISKKTSVVAQDKSPVSRVNSNLNDIIVHKEETDNDIKITVYYIDSKGSTLDCFGIQGDYGWKPVIKDGDSSNDFLAFEKTFLKSELPANFYKVIRVAFNGFYDEFCFSRCDGISLRPDNYRVYCSDIVISNVQIKNIQVLSQENFLKQLQDLDRLFEDEAYADNKTLDNDIKFDAYFIGYGEFKAFSSSRPKKADNSIQVRIANRYYNGNMLIVYRLTVSITRNYNLEISIDCKTVGDDVYYETDNSEMTISNNGFPNSYIAEYLDDDVKFQLFMPKYNNYLYICTGKYSIMQIDINPNVSFSDTSIINIGAKDKAEDDALDRLIQSNVYKPVPYEITNPGFNIIADKPLSYIDSAGNVDTIRGVFYTTSTDKEPIQNVPCNIPFNINVIMTGSTTPDTPKIRPNNGELDEGKNPYTNLSGVWQSDDSSTGFMYFECKGIDSIEAYEMKITKGTDEYITYFTPTPYVPKTTGTLSEISDLVLGCPRCKIINNQLVLFGNGGYIFFSDFENFKYFPSYYYVYVANGTDEEIVDIVYFRQYYAIFTNKRILRMSGDFATDNFEIGPLNDFMGCVNHNTIRQVYNSLYFIGYNGIYSLNQGYLGTGTENLKRIDTQLVNTFNFDNVAYCYVLGNIYIIIMKDGKTWYTYDVDNDMFLRYDYSLGDSVTLSNINFIETLEENQIYAILATSKEDNNYADDLLLYNFPLTRDANYDYKDSDEGYVSSFETPYINLGTPTNTKKFKNLFIKMFNETDSLIPLYITVYVDDILAITPEDYTIELDEETNTYFYYFKVENNAELLRAHNLLGTLTLGEDTLGDNIIQQLKLKVNAKGRAIKIILADGYDYPNKDNSDIIKYRNSKKFSISTIGIVYKLKKVKEG